MKCLKMLKELKPCKLHKFSYFFKFWTDKNWGELIIFRVANPLGQAVF